jgi:hypothetical protein
MAEQMIESTLGEMRTLSTLIGNARTTHSALNNVNLMADALAENSMYVVTESELDLIRLILNNRIRELLSDAYDLIQKKMPDTGLPW